MVWCQGVVTLNKKVLFVVLAAFLLFVAGCADSRKIEELKQEVATLESRLEQAYEDCRSAVRQSHEDCQVVIAAYEKKLAAYEERLAKLEGSPLYCYSIGKSGFTFIGAECVKVIADVVPGKPGALTNEELLQIARYVVDDITSTQVVNAVSLSFWNSEDSRERGEYARGCIDWGPNGDFFQAESVKPGDYSRHSFRVVYNRTDKPVTLRRPFLSESQQKGVFYEIVERQDQISLWDPDYQEKNQRAKEEIASKYGISMDELSEIIMEGATERWPMPDPPPGSN